MRASAARIARWAGAGLVGVLAVGLAVLGVGAVSSGLHPAPVSAAPAAAATAAPAVAPPAPMTAAPVAADNGWKEQSAAPTPPASAAPEPPAPAPATVPGIPCDLPVTGNGACVQLSTQRAWLVSDGQVVTRVPVATGKSGATTPRGSFSVLSKAKDYHSTEFDNAPMPYSVFFYPGDAFHGGSVSTRSNGCVHLSLSTAKQFFNTLHVGDPVKVVR